MMQVKPDLAIWKDIFKGEMLDAVNKFMSYFAPSDGRPRTTHSKILVQSPNSEMNYQFSNIKTLPQSSTQKRIPSEPHKANARDYMLLR